MQSQSCTHGTLTVSHPTCISILFQLYVILYLSPSYLKISFGRFRLYSYAIAGVLLSSVKLQPNNFWQSSLNRQRRSVAASRFSRVRNIVPYLYTDVYCEIVCPKNPKEGCLFVSVSYEFTVKCNELLQLRMRLMQ